MYYYAEFGRSALKDVGIITEKKRKNWGAVELRFLGMGSVADPKIHAQCLF